MNDRLASWVVERRILLFIVSILLLVFLGYGLGQLKFNSSYKIFFSDDNEQMLAHELVQDTYTKTDNLVFVIRPRDEQVFTRSTLASVEVLTEESWLLPYAARVDSISNFQHTQVIDDDLMVENLVEDAEQLTLKQIETIKNVASNEIALVNSLLSETNHATAINVKLNLPTDSAQIQGEATLELVQAARELKKRVEADNPNLKIYLQGLAVVNVAFNESAEYDASHLFPALFLLILIMLLILLRSFWSAVATSIVIVVAVLVSQGFMGWISYDLNQVNVMAPIIILTLAVCDCVHILALSLIHI